MTDRLPTPIEQWERYERDRAEHERALQAWRDGGKQGPPPPMPIPPHTPGWNYTARYTP